MDCRDVTALAIDRLAGEADGETCRELAEHLAACETCPKEMARLEDAWTMLGTDPDASLTAEFRQRTLALLEEEMLRGRVRAFRPRSRFGRPLAQAAALAVAASLGYLLARGLPRAGSPPAAPAPSATPVASSPLPGPGSESRLSNVSYFPPGADGRVGIQFDLTTRRTLVGRPEDPEVAAALAYMLSRSSETAGDRARTIALVSEHYGAGGTPASPEIVAALSNTLRKDSNPGVRKKAADALASFTMTPEIRAVFLEALGTDKNPAVRLTAVDALAASTKLSPDERTIASLREKAVDPKENGFVRAKAASALKAISF